MSSARSMTKFVVRRTGYGTFPMDMLRYDCCWPADTTSALNVGRIVETQGVRDEQPDITLLTWQTGITPDRWASFGWTVVSQERV